MTGNDSVKVFGADWCEDTQATRNHLDSLGVPYQYINVEQDAKARDWVKQQNNGKQKTPTVDIGGKILVEPDEQELEQALRGTGLMS
jgi:glutaredoxin